MSCEHTVGLFQLGNEINRILLQILQQYFRLLQIVMRVKFFLELQYLDFFLPHELVNRQFHPLEKRIDKLRIFQQ